MDHSGWEFLYTITPKFFKVVIHYRFRFVWRVVYGPSVQAAPFLLRGGNRKKQWIAHWYLYIALFVCCYHNLLASTSRPRKFSSFSVSYPHQATVRGRSNAPPPTRRSIQPQPDLVSLSRQQNGAEEEIEIWGREARLPSPCNRTVIGDRKSRKAIALKKRASGLTWGSFTRYKVLGGFNPVSAMEQQRMVLTAQFDPDGCPAGYQ